MPGIACTERKRWLSGRIPTGLPVHGKDVEGKVKEFWGVAAFGKNLARGLPKKPGQGSALDPQRGWPL